MNSYKICYHVNLLEYFNSQVCVQSRWSSKGHRLYVITTGILEVQVEIVQMPMDKFVLRISPRYHKIDANPKTSIVILLYIYIDSPSFQEWVFFPIIDTNVW